MTPAGLFTNIVWRMLRCWRHPIARAIVLLVNQQIIEALEEELRLAILASDVATLDRLLADDVLYTDPNGHLLDKATDLITHASGLLRVDEMVVEDRVVMEKRGVAVVLVRARLSGQYDGTPIKGTFAYTRVWSLTQRQVIAAACTAVTA